MFVSGSNTAWTPQLVDDQQSIERCHTVFVIDVVDISRIAPGNR